MVLCPINLLPFLNAVLPSNLTSLKHPATSSNVCKPAPTNAPELGRRLSISKQAAAKTIAVLQERGYVERAPDRSDGRRKRLQVTKRDFAVLREGEAIFDDFTLDKEDEQTFLEAWQDDAMFMKTQPGFISTQLHALVACCIPIRRAQASIRP